MIICGDYYEYYYLVERLLLCENLWLIIIIFLGFIMWVINWIYLRKYFGNFEMFYRGNDRFFLYKYLYYLEKISELVGCLIVWLVI